MKAIQVNGLLNDLGAESHSQVARSPRFAGSLSEGGGGQVSPRVRVSRSQVPCDREGASRCPATKVAERSGQGRFPATQVAERPGPDLGGRLATWPRSLRSTQVPNPRPRLVGQPGGNAKIASNFMIFL